MKSLIFGFLILSACTTSTKKGDAFKAAPQKSEQALLYVYRPPGDWGTARSPTIIVDKDKKYDALYKGYRYFYLNAGEHSVEVDGGKPKVRFIAETGKTYYLLYNMKGNQSSVGLSFGLIGALLTSALTPDGPSPEVKAVLAEGIALDGFDENLYFVKAEPALNDLAQTSLVVDKVDSKSAKTPSTTDSNSVKR